MSERYDRDRALRLVPLLLSISLEIQERTDSLRLVEARLDELGDPGPTREFLDLTAEAANHRRELRLAREELDRLGCSIVGTEPLTIRIPAREGNARTSYVWRSGDPVPR